MGERTISFTGIGNILSLILSTLVKLHKQLFLVVNILYASLAWFFLRRNMRRHLNPRITGQLRTVVGGVSVCIVGYTLAKGMPFFRGPFASPGVGSRK